jgi:hypothetical protein
MMIACFQNPMGGTGLWPVVSGVPPETVMGRELALVPAINQQWMAPDEIRWVAQASGLLFRASRPKPLWDVNWLWFLQ